MFKYECHVRMHHTDMAGVIFFGNQFHIMHDAFEELMTTEGYTFQSLLTNESFIFAIVHADSDFIRPLHAGDPLTIEVSTKHIGNTSFTIAYTLYKNADKVGSGNTVHVCLNKESRTKQKLPKKALSLLQKYLKK